MTLGEDWQDKLRALQPNWNSYGAPKISELAIAVIESLQVTPDSNGGIVLYIIRDGFDVQLTVGPEGKVDFLLFSRIGCRTEPA